MKASELKKAFNEAIDKAISEHGDIEVIDSLDGSDITGINFDYVPEEGTDLPECLEVYFTA